MRQIGLRELDATLRKADATEFEETALNAIQLYSRAALQRDLSDRLVYYFAALESLLLRDGRESLVHNISERMAFLLEREPDKRLEIIEDVKATYGLRSRFVHHGQSVADSVLFERFGRHAWRFFSRVALSLPHFATKAAFIDAIERIKLS